MRLLVFLAGLCLAAGFCGGLLCLAAGYQRWGVLGAAAGITAAAVSALFGAAIFALISIDRRLAQIVQLETASREA